MASPEFNLPYVLLCISVYTLSLAVIYQNAFDESRRSINQNETTLLVIAHPDDESMFFGPTIIRKLDGDKDKNLLKINNLNDRFYLLCITQGNQYGLGNLRKLELVKSASKLGIKEKNIKIMDDIRWLDGENQIWHKQSLQEAIINEILSKNITELITFDEYGVSGHLNHQTLFKVVKLIKSKIDFVKFYTLRSINVIQKYLAILDFPLYYLFLNREPNQIYIVNLNEHFKLVDAFYYHQSQIVWFRKLYSLFSKYMYINILDEMEF